MTGAIEQAACLACESTTSHQLAYLEDIPLSVVGLPTSPEEAREMADFVLDVRRCSECGHVFHTQFDVDRVPYERGSNLVYNGGNSWVSYLGELAERWIETYGLKQRVLAEIGAGDGGFLARFLEAGNLCHAWEPGPDAESCATRGLITHRSYLGGEEIRAYRPDALICRHVLEHMPAPLKFLRELRLAALETGIQPLFLAEVPRIDKALSQHRITDFLYEHVSNFTEHSFQVLFQEAGYEVLEVEAAAGDEVVWIAARPRSRERQRIQTEEDYAAASRAFFESIDEQVSNIERSFEFWARAGRRVALWGATGKGASLMNIFNIDAGRVDLVIDSDERKVGTFVPGTGQEIKGPEALATEPPDVILICTNWRARDIEHEIREVHGISSELFVYHERQIVPLAPDLAL